MKRAWQFGCAHQAALASVSGWLAVQVDMEVAYGHRPPCAAGPFTEVRPARLKN
jgi:hypothetical protein